MCELVRDCLFGLCCLRSFAWELPPGTHRLGSLVWDHSLGIVRLRSLAWELSLGIMRFEALGWIMSFKASALKLTSALL